MDLSPRAAPEPFKLPMPARDEVLAVIGPSGAGKSLALQRLLAENPGTREAVRLQGQMLDTPVPECFPVDVSSQRVLRVLARVGLADGRLWAAKAGALSGGERRRLEIALALIRDGVLVIDEFEAHLDADTSRLLAQNLRRLCADRALVVTTHRPETLAYLHPSRVLEIDRGLHEHAVPAPRDMLDEIEFVPGRKRDYAGFAGWHYLGPGNPGPTSDVWLALHRGRAVGIVVFGYPHLLLGARNEALPEHAPARIREHGAGALNADVRLLQRVVVEPRWRGIGLARALIRHGLCQLDVSTVECVAQMGDFSGFLTGAGFKRAGEVRLPRAVRDLVAFMERHGIVAAALIDPGRRAAVMRSLAPGARKTLATRLRALVRTRVETGFGSMRGNITRSEPVLRKALSRLHARPAYFLWRRP